MALSIHQQKHLLAVKQDAFDFVKSRETRMVKEADDLLDEKVAWPSQVRTPAGIHDFIERPILDG